MYNLTDLGSPNDLALTWPEVKFWPWHIKVKLYMVRRALTRQTRWYHNRCSTCTIKDLIVQKPFWKILECWPLVTSILTWDKNNRNYFEMIFRELSNAVFCFVLRYAGAEIDGVCSNTPPPPSGCGKSRGPSGRGLIVWVRPNRPLYVIGKGHGSKCPPPPGSVSAQRWMWLMAILTTWDKTSLDTIRSSIGQWKRRLNAVVQAAGGPFAHVFQ